MKLWIWATALTLSVPAIFWLGGLDFTERSPGLALCFVLTAGVVTSMFILIASVREGDKYRSKASFGEGPSW